MSPAGKKVCLVVTIVFSLILLALAIYFSVEAATLESKVNGALNDWGSGGVLVAKPTDSNSTLLENQVGQEEIIVYRWDHQDGDNTFTHVTANLMMNNETKEMANVSICVITEAIAPTLASCRTANSTDAGVCYEAKQSVYIGIYSPTGMIEAFTVQLVWSMESTDENWCTALGLLGGLITIFGLIGIFIALAIVLCCFLMCCGTAIYLARDVRKHYGYHEV